MPKITGKYETVFIVDVNLGEENIAALVEKFTNLIASNGTVECRRVGQAPSGLSHQRRERRLLCSHRV